MHSAVVSHENYVLVLFGWLGIVEHAKFQHGTRYLSMRTRRYLSMGLRYWTQYEVCLLSLVV